LSIPKEKVIEVGTDLLAIVNQQLEVKWGEFALYIILNSF